MEFNAFSDLYPLAGRSVPTPEREDSPVDDQGRKKRDQSVRVKMSEGGAEALMVLPGGAAFFQIYR